MKVYITKDNFNYADHLLKYRPIVTLNPQEGFKVSSQVNSSMGNSILESWHAPKVRVLPEELDKPIADLSHIGSNRGPLTVNAAAADALRDLLEHSGELLPLTSDEGAFHIYNVTKVVDAFDFDKAAYTWYSVAVNEAISKIDIYAFKPWVLEGLPAFRFLKSSSRAYYTDIFKTRVEEAGLTGIIFQLIWDSENPEYHDERFDLEQWERVKAARA